MGDIKIGVLSDSHWIMGRPLPGAVEMLNQLKPAAIFHAGDLGDLQLLKELEAIAPVYAVAGNCDHLYTAEKLGRKLIAEVGGLKFGLTHGDLGSGANTPKRAAMAFAHDDVAAVIFGHSHQPYNQKIPADKGERLLFNPGSCVRPLGEIPQPSFGILTINNGQVNGDIYYLKK